MHGPKRDILLLSSFKTECCVCAVLPAIRLNYNCNHLSNPPHIHTHTLRHDTSFDCTGVLPPLLTTIFPLSLTHTQKQRHIINNRTLASFLFHPGEKHTVWNTLSSKSCIQIELHNWHQTRYLIA